MSPERVVEDPPARVRAGVTWLPTTSWDISHPSLYTADGRVNVDAATIQVNFADGSNIRLPVVEGLFLGSLDRKVEVTQVTAYDKDGNQVAQMTRP